MLKTIVSFAMFSISSLVATTGRANEASRLYAQPMRWAADYERQVNFVKLYCPPTREVNKLMPRDGESPYEPAQEPNCLSNTNKIISSLDKYCDKNTKQRFLDGLPVPYVCLAPANPLTTSEVLSTAAEIERRDEELINSVTGNSGPDARARLKSLMKELQKEIDAEKAVETQAGAKN